MQWPVVANTDARIQIAIRRVPSLPIQRESCTDGFAALWAADKLEPEEEREREGSEE
jgi:hypothetical protein